MAPADSRHAFSMPNVRYVIFVLFSVIVVGVTCAFFVSKFMPGRFMFWPSGVCLEDSGLDRV